MDYPTIKSHQDIVKSLEEHINNETEVLRIITYYNQNGEYETRIAIPQLTKEIQIEILVNTMLGIKERLNDLKFKL